MGVGAVLAIFVWAERAAVLIDGGFFSDFSIGKNRKDGERSRRVICDEDEFAGLVEGNVAGVFAEHGNLIELCELARFCVECEGSDETRFTAFVDGVEKFATGMNHDEGGIGRFRSNSHRGELAAFCVVTEFVDAFALRFGGVSSSEGEEVGRLRLLRFLVFCGNKKSWNEQ